MRVLVTGADGFIARNLIVRLGEQTDWEVLRFSRQTPEASLRELVAQADAVIHLAGVNRPPSPDDFAVGNTGLTELLCEHLNAAGRAIPVIFSSSIQAEMDNPYGRSKRAAEDESARNSKRNCKDAEEGDDFCCFHIFLFFTTETRKHREKNKPPCLCASVVAFIFSQTRTQSRARRCPNARRGRA